LPSAVLAEIERQAAGEPLAKLRARATAVSDHYRGRNNSQGVIRDDCDAAAYALMRLPGTYAACSHALAEAHRLLPFGTPTSLWDIGCGPGAATIAAQTIYPEIKRIKLTDRLQPFLHLAGTLVSMGAPAAKIEKDQIDLSHVAEGKHAAVDLAMISYVLTELEPKLAEALVLNAWQSVSQIMVLVEPGTPAGFLQIARMRQQLIAAGANIVAPCTHAHACPREATAAGAAPVWCRFVERLPRSSLHRRIKQGTHGYEDESFAYLVATRIPASISGGRVIGPVERSKVELSAPVCIEGAEKRFKVATRDKQKTNQFKRLSWGDQVENP
jgi:ribosomal protein RSM22 (predicted rRNA methylase)